MISVHEKFREYATAHSNPVNKKIHYVFVPIIIIGLIGLLTAAHPNAALIFAALAMVYYFMLSIRLALGMAAFAAIIFGIVYYLQNHMATPLWIISATLFVIGWFAQYVGHGLIEKKKPNFFTDIRFLLLGPLWLIAEFYKRTGIRY